MTQRGLTADNAASLLYRACCPDNFITQEFIEKAEFVIQTYATKGCKHAFFRVPVIYSSVPAYNFNTMIKQIVDHFIEKGFFVKHIHKGYLWISWRYAFDKYVEKRQPKKKRNRRRKRGRDA